MTKHKNCSFRGHRLQRDIKGRQWTLKSYTLGWDPYTAHCGEHRESTDPLAAIIESDHTFQAPHTEPGTKVGDQQVTFLFLLNCLNLHGWHARCGDKMTEYLEKMGISGLG